MQMVWRNATKYWGNVDLTTLKNKNFEHLNFGQ